MTAAQGIVQSLLEDEGLDPKDEIFHSLTLRFPQALDRPRVSGYYCYVASDNPESAGWFEGPWDTYEEAARYYDSECSDGAKIIDYDATTHTGTIKLYTRYTDVGECVVRP